MSFSRRALALALAALLVVLLVLEAGLWVRTETHHGPFLGEKNNPTVFFTVGWGWLNRCCVGARTDVPLEPERSKLRLWIGGVEYPHAHSGHDVIRTGAPGTFSHWINELRLALPEGQPNDAGAAVRIAYPVQILDRNVSLSLIVATALALLAVLGPALHPRVLLHAARRQRHAVALLLLVAIAATSALELGGWRRTEVIPGPFATDPNSKALFVPVDRDRGPSWLLGARGDDDEAPMRSGLTFSVDGHAYAKSHADLSAIGAGELDAYCHWGVDVFFTLPPGVPNAWSTHAMLRYPLRLASPWMTAAILAALAAALVRVERSWLTPRRGAALTRWPCGAAAMLAAAGAALAAVYAGTIAVAWARGWALPSTAAIIGSPEGRWLARAEPRVPEFLLLLSTLGALAGRAARWRGVDGRADEARVLRVMGFVGLAVLFAGLLLSASAQWAGLWRQGDFSFVSIAGIVPFSDAGSYYADANDVVNSGLFGPVGARRPLAQAFRSTLLAAGGYSYVSMVALQSLMLASAIFAAAAAVARWSGLWAALAFAAMAYAAAREYTPTALTEPLGLFWGLCAVPPLVRALRDGSARHALLASGLLVLALFNRMGSMLTIPALLVWLIACFGTTLTDRLRIAVAAFAVLVGIVGLNAATAALYTRDAGMTGSNFSYTLCGLTIGESWSVCEDRYKDELPASDRSEQAMVHLMYRKAFENFRTHPSVLFERMGDGAYRFVKGLPRTLTQGYLSAPQLFPATLPILLLLSAAGLARRVPRMHSRERVFWILFWSSAVVSAGIVYFDDGLRVMIAIYPIAGLFIANGLGDARESVAAPMRDGRPARRAETFAFAAAALFLACVFTPWIVHRFIRPNVYFPPGTPLAYGQGRAPGEQFIFGGSRATGELVVADDQPLRTDVPTLHLSDFLNIVRQSRVESVQALVTPVPPAPPFGFVDSPNLIPGEPSKYRYITPAAVVLRKDVRAWRLETAGLPLTAGYEANWLLATGAMPLDPEAILRLDRAARAIGPTASRSAPGTRAATGP